MSMMSCEIHTWTLSAVGVSDYPALPHVRLPIPGHPRLQTDAEVHWNAPVDAETERADAGGGKVGCRQSEFLVAPV